MGLGWMDYGARMYMNDIGDPTGQKPGDPTKPGTNIWFRESGATAGLGYGLVASQQEGTASDRAGKTHFALRTLTTTSIENKNWSGGLELNLLSFGYKYDKRSTFLETVSGSDLSTPGPGLKGKAGIGLTFNSNSVAVSLGLGVGAAGNFVDDDVVYSISVSHDEAEKVSDATDTWLEEWKVSEENRTKLYNESGDLIALEAPLLVKNTEGKYVDTGVKVKSYDENKAVWTSDAYNSAARRLIQLILDAPKKNDD